MRYANKNSLQRGQAQRKSAGDAGWRGLSIIKDLSIHFKDFLGSLGKKRD